MERLWFRWKRYIALSVVLSLLATGLILSCGRSGGGGGSSSSTGTPTPETGTGTVVITGRIL